ncbi:MULTISPECIES: HK97 gp10 family phage protein [unclassified Enterococcus]|uniref:HK97 gp10 family phage protein n=1 Tax=unclassified Enterococcus TaxID=2608891 RepID=UPI003F68DE4D
MSNTIHISELSKEIAKTVKNYTKEVEIATGEATEVVAKETLQELKQTSPKRSGKYAKNWRKKKQSVTQQIIYQNDPTYRLTHLLENGHALKRGGRSIGNVSAIPHIEKAEEKAIISLEKELIRRLNR